MNEPLKSSRILVKMSKFTKIILLCLLIMTLSGCIDREELRLSTTTSTCDTGILDVINEKFEKEYKVKILTVCQGTGKTIATGELGAADVVLVHSPSAELEAVSRGSFINRSYIMFNYFVITGPVTDPAGIKEASSASDAFTRIAAKRSQFVSRGDDSGTHKKERSIWEAANITPSGSWYQSVGKGMGESLITADIKEGYTLSDRGTYLAMKNKIKLEILFESDKEYLFNPYHIMAVDPGKFPGIRYDLALKYIRFITSPGTREIILDYGKDKYSEALFVPADESS